MLSILLNTRQEDLGIKPPTLQLMGAPLNYPSYKLLSGTMGSFTSNKKKSSFENTADQLKKTLLKLTGWHFEPQQQDIFKMGVIRNPLGFIIIIKTSEFKGTVVLCAILREAVTEVKNTWSEVKSLCRCVICASVCAVCIFT